MTRKKGSKRAKEQKPGSLVLGKATVKKGPKTAGKRTITKRGK
jgi:hypothetical protein